MSDVPFETPYDVRGAPPSEAAAAAPREERARPRCRERLLEVGAARLADAELVALILGTGSRAAPVEQTARALLVRCGGLAGLCERGPTALAAERGLGPVGAARLAAAAEIARRVAASPADRPPVRDPEEVVREVRDLCIEPREHLVGLYLDAHARLIARETVAVGSLNVARATPRDLLEPALRRLAAGFVMVHNHPSGVAEPSEDDVLFTRAVARAAALMGVPLWDHVVVSRCGHASLRARGVQWEGQDARP